ncbi:acyl-CoA dehydrogenase family protein [Phytohabitans sp. ZYX-F-186]|uniref:Acyl-CoA dehydrogenase family protein n=1 Tax=Phytohabitans maris TaxID=3071409 RepID=A0ABU0ZCS5_9ACTN|nr:acyl-CoA dehydrogenase family protein [Phytohabitans sp. ZYX-F-186]MDQ7903727.1 acyl-CoA dehydrogenase family protein [Phytohabitans sp. ZYX-F-186]
MDLPVPEHMRPLRERMLAFLTERVYPVEKTLERGKLDPEGGGTLRRLQDEAKEAGLWALGHPTSMGGGGLPYLDYLYVNEVVGMSEYAIYVFGTHTLHDCLMLDRYASEEWRDKYLRPMADGDIPGPSFGMTERDVASSDPTQLRTAAVLDGDEWVINGHKWFTTHAHSARYTVVMARTEPDAPPHKAFSMIIVPTDTPGYDIVRTIPVMGETDGDHCEVRYDDVRVPAGNLLGARGAAFAIAQQRLLPGRIFHVMRFLGQAQRAFDLLCERAVSRVAFGSALADKQLIQKMVFDSAAEIQSTRLLVLEAARRLDAGEEPRVEVGIAKVMGAAMLHNVIDRAIQVYGSIGLTADLPLERMYRQARFARLYDGPDETHVQNVARMLLRPYRPATP